MENSPIIEFHTLRLTIFEASFEWLSFVSVFDFVFFFQKAVLRTHSQAGFDGLVAYCFGGRLRYTVSTTSRLFPESFIPRGEKCEIITQGGFRVWFKEPLTSSEKLGHLWHQTP